MKKRRPVTEAQLKSYVASLPNVSDLDVYDLPTVKEGFREVEKAKKQHDRRRKKH